MNCKILRYSLLAAIILAVNFCVKAQEKKQMDWKSIKLFQTTKAEVEKMFGKQDDPKEKFNILYKTEDFNLLVDYTYGRCSDEENSGWNLEPNIVTNLVVQFKPNKEPFLVNLEPDLTKLKEVEAHAGVFLSNEGADVVYTVSPDKIFVYSARYHSARLGKDLRCEKPRFPAR